MSGVPSAAPVLSSPDTRMLEEDHIANHASAIHQQISSHSDAEIDAIYEVERTVSEIRAGGWRRVALQFPDSYLPDAPRLVARLQTHYAQAQSLQTEDAREEIREEVTGAQDFQSQSLTGEYALHSRPLHEGGEQPHSPASAQLTIPRFYILADTSYGACCVDEVAAEHVDADVLVHYGRACLSPVSRLPVIYVFTHQNLDLDHAVATFQQTFDDHAAQVILMADVTVAKHLPELQRRLHGQGYTSLFPTDVIHQPDSLIPNRTVPAPVQQDPQSLQSYHIFHLAEPPAALLLTLASRVSSFHICPLKAPAKSEPAHDMQRSTAQALRRRYAQVMALAGCSVFGILVNTLSVSQHQAAVDRLRSLIADAGRKAYTFVMGKLNAAKLANFAEIEGWVVVGCWESSLVEGEGFWRPMVTPFELELVLQPDKDRVWTGAWRGDFEHIGKVTSTTEQTQETLAAQQAQTEDADQDEQTDDEMAPPEFDLRTGRLVATTNKPRRRDKAHMGGKGTTTSSGKSTDQALAIRRKGDLARIGNEISPGAVYLKTQRTWQGLGSDFEIKYEETGQQQGTLIEEGRSGIARGYANEKRVGDG